MWGLPSEPGWLQGLAPAVALVESPREAPAGCGGLAPEVGLAGSPWGAPAGCGGLVPMVGAGGVSRGPPAGCVGRVAKAGGAMQAAGIVLAVHASTPSMTNMCRGLAPEVAPVGSPK